MREEERREAHKYELVPGHKMNAVWLIINQTNPIVSILHRIQ